MTQSTRYRLIFDGSMLPGREPQQIQAEFGRRFKIEAARLPRFFSGKPVVLKRNLSKDAAQQLGQALNDVGVTFHLEEEPDVQADGEKAPRSAPPTPLLDAESDNALAPWEHTDDAPPLLSDEMPTARQKFHQKAMETQRTQAVHWRGLALILLSAVAVLLVVVWINKAEHQAIDHPDGILVAQTPISVAVDEPGFLYKGYTLLPRADVTVQGRLLGKMDYSSDRTALISPTDLALGWGDMSNSRMLKKLNYYQSNRAFVWAAKNNNPVPRRLITASFANIRIIPGNSSVADQLPYLRPGHLVRLEGQLVDVTGPAGNWEWFTSVSWKDRGNMSCEIMYVTRLTRLAASP